LERVYKFVKTLKSYFSYFANKIKTANLEIIQGIISITTKEKQKSSTTPVKPLLYTQIHSFTVSF